MKSVVCPELSTAAAGSSQAPTAAVDNSAPSSTHPEPTYKSGKAVQITGTTSDEAKATNTNWMDARYDRSFFSGNPRTVLLFVHWRRTLRSMSCNALPVDTLRSLKKGETS